MKNRETKFDALEDQELVAAVESGEDVPSYILAERIKALLCAVAVVPPMVRIQCNIEAAKAAGK